MSKINNLRLNIEIENSLYPLISLLKETEKPETEIEADIANFKERYRDLLVELDENYVENYLNKIYAKRNNGKTLLQIKKNQDIER